MSGPVAGYPGGMIGAGPPTRQSVPVLALSLLLHAILLALLSGLGGPGPGTPVREGAVPLSVWLQAAPTGRRLPRPATGQAARDPGAVTAVANAMHAQRPTAGHTRSGGSPASRDVMPERAETSLATPVPSDAVSTDTEASRRSVGADPSAAPALAGSGNPSSPVPLDAQTVRRSIRAFAREEQAAQLPGYQDSGPPPPGSRERLGYEIQQSFHPDCKDAYPTAGLYRIPLWMIDALRAKGCRW